MDELQFEYELIQYLCHGAVSSAQSLDADSVASDLSTMLLRQSSGDMSRILKQPTSCGKTSRASLKDIIGQHSIIL